MKKSLQLLMLGFESSTMKTPEFMAFVRTFRSEITKALKDRGCTEIEIGAGHFYVNGFFTSPSGQVYYISLSDVRSFRYGQSCFGQLMYRTAKNYKDFTGGVNQWIDFTSDLVENMRIS